MAPFTRAPTPEGDTPTVAEAVARVDALLLPPAQHTSEEEQEALQHKQQHRRDVDRDRYWARKGRDPPSRIKRPKPVRRMGTFKTRRAKDGRITFAIRWAGAEAHCPDSWEPSEDHPCREQLTEASLGSTHSEAKTMIHPAPHGKKAGALD